MRPVTKYIEINMSYSIIDISNILYIDTYYTHSNFYTFKYTFTPLLF